MNVLKHFTYLSDLDVECPFSFKLWFIVAKCVKWPWFILSITFLHTPLSCMQKKTLYLHKDAYLIDEALSMWF